MATYSKYSMYSGTIQKDGLLGVYQDIPITKHSSDYVMKVPPRYHNRPDLLAMDLYGAPGLWWIIPRLNDFSDLVFDMYEGREINIMTLQRFQTFK